MSAGADLVGVPWVPWHPLQNSEINFTIYVTLNTHQVVAIFRLFLDIMMMFSVNFEPWHPQASDSRSATAVLTYLVASFQITFPPISVSIPCGHAVAMASLF